MVQFGRRHKGEGEVELVDDANQQYFIHCQIQYCAQVFHQNSRVAAAAAAAVGVRIYLDFRSTRQLGQLGPEVSVSGVMMNEHASESLSVDFPSTLVAHRKQVQSFSARRRRENSEINRARRSIGARFLIGKLGLFAFGRFPLSRSR